MSNDEIRLGTKPGIICRATIIDNNEDGTVLVSLDQGNLSDSPKRFTVPIPLAWAGPQGEFIGGYPQRGSSVIVSQAQGGEWFIVSYINSDDIFSSNFVSEANPMSELNAGSAMIQVAGGGRILVDPDDGIRLGKESKFLQANHNKNIISHNFDRDMSFTEASRNISGTIKRDLQENLSRNVLGSTLTSQDYYYSLFSIGMDISSIVSAKTDGESIRNPPLNESRELILEYGESFNVLTDRQEYDLYSDPSNRPDKANISRRNMSADALSLSLEHPNHLIETIKGTAVDTFGNILDLNRSVLPIGKISDLSFRKTNEKKENVFSKIKEQHRKGIAYSFTLNAKKGETIGEVFDTPNTNSTENYSRNRSRFSFDIDKEGQFKLNIPSSSETGNIPLLTRFENFSVIKSKENSGQSNPNEFLRSTTAQEIFLDNFAGKANIKLNNSGDGELNGYAAPIDRITDKTISYGTAYHDILDAGISFTERAPYLQASQPLVNWDPNHPLNTDWTPLEKIISDTITVSGSDANAGGRSGSINLDGFLQVNVGANTIDRQSVHFDYAGSVIGSVGRDLNGVSYVSHLDGDMFVEIGGAGIGNSFDTRFANENDAVRNGTLDIRVFLNGQFMIFRMGPQGIDILSPGRITMSCQQDMIFRTNASMKFEAPTIVMHAESTKRIINKLPPGGSGGNI